MTTMKKILFILIILFSGNILGQLDPGMIKKNINFNTTPQGAKVFLKLKGGQWEFLGITPFTEMIRIGEKEFKIELAKYKPYLGKLNSNKMRKVEILLEPQIIQGTALGHYFIYSNETVKDTKTGLIWQKTNSGKMNWENALKYCPELKLGDEKWRLPSISELQTLFAGNEKNKHCKVSDTCLSKQCYLPCKSSSLRKGPGEKGFYWHKGVWDKPEGALAFYWSNSYYNGDPDTNNVWAAQFYDGNIYYYSTVYQPEQKFHVRCVTTHSPIQ